MSSILFSIDPMASVSYAAYKSVKKDSSNFVDFLLHYDSQSANDGDNTWLDKLTKAQTNTQTTLLKNLYHLNLLTNKHHSNLLNKDYHIQ